MACNRSGVRSVFMGVSGNSDSVRGESLEAAFERFVTASAPRLLRSAYVLTGDHADADDLLQNALLRTLRYWSSIGTSPVGYAFRVMVNLSHDRRRAQRRRPARAPEHDALALPAVDELERVVERDAIVAAVGRLARVQREGLACRFVVGLGVVET